MTRYLDRDELLLVYQYVMEQSGGLVGIRDAGLIEAALAQPAQTFDGEDLYPSLPEKTAALGFALIKNHPFTDGNKRIGYAAMRMFLGRNGYRIVASVDDLETRILGVASGGVDRAELAAWIAAHTVPR